MICCLLIQNEQLYYAAEEGRLDDVIQLISEGADPSWEYASEDYVSNIIILYHTHYSTNNNEYTIVLTLIITTSIMI